MTTYNITSGGYSLSGFWWDGEWHEVRPSAGEDGPPTGVREARRPQPSAPAGSVALAEEST